MEKHSECFIAKIDVRYQKKNISNLAYVICVAPRTDETLGIPRQSYQWVFAYQCTQMEVAVELEKQGQNAGRYCSHRLYVQSSLVFRDI